MIINYPHKTGTHCETASTKNLLEFYGFRISEEMIFGIGSGLNFIHFPFPFFTKNEASLFRTVPTSVLKNFAKRINLKVKVKTFLNKEKSMKKLNALLDQGIPTGVVTEVYGLYYWRAIMPEWHRFPGHHIIIVGKEKNEYYISETDVMFSDHSLYNIKYEELKEARFTNKFTSPKGKLFYVKSIPQTIDLKLAILKGIKSTCYNMLDIPMPFFGVKGIRFLSKRMLKYEKIYGKSLAIDNLRFQLLLSEEAGTGGSGFRYFYAKFLSEAAELFNDNQLFFLSKEMRQIADQWRSFAVETLRYTKVADNGYDPFPKTATWENLRQKPVNEETDMKYLSDMIFSIAEKEEIFFKELREWVKTKE
jgi:hypothetical protein